MWFLLVIIQVFWLFFQLSFIFADHYLDTLNSVDIAKRFKLHCPLNANEVALPILPTGLWSELSEYRATAILWWQNWIDETLLVRMPIVGTHHSATYTINNVISLFAKTQRYSLTEQLNRGVRAFDIRLKLRSDGKLYAYHDFVDLNVSWRKLWNSIESWMKAFPREGILMLIRDENYKDHWEIAKKALAEVASDRFIRNNDQFDLTQTLRLKDLRGKVFLLNQNEKYTLPWGDNRNFVIGRVNVSDRYEVKNVDEKVQICKKFYADIPTIGGEEGDRPRVGYLNILYTSVANKNPFSSLRSLSDQINEAFQKHLRDANEPVKGCIIMMDWFV
jgi:hypothetical protein